MGRREGGRESQLIITEPGYSIVYIALSSDNVVVFIDYSKAFNSINQLVPIDV